KDVSLVGSATGDLGGEQIARLGQLIAGAPEPRIVVLMHHAPIRWDGEPDPGFRPRGLSRWVSLAMSNAGTAALADVLAEAGRSGKEIVLVWGHRHGGETRAARVGRWEGGIVIEGAALAHDARAVVLLGHREDGLVARTL